MKIPADALAADTLANLIEEFVLREGTDYGHHDYSLTGKVEQVMKQIQRGEAWINYDPESKTVNIERSETFKPESSNDDNSGD